MLITKRGKLVLICIAAAAAFVGGTILEHIEHKPFIEESVAGGDLDGAVLTADSAVNSDGQININSADSEALQTLDGIGEKLAGRIIEYRSENGDFSQTEGIMLVPGIGEQLYEDIKDDICVSGDG